VLTDFCDHNPTVVAVSPFGLFPAVSPHDPAWLDRMDHLRELLSLAEPLDVTQTLARCLNVVFTLQGLRNTAAIIGSVWRHLGGIGSSPSAAELYTYSDAAGE
jgi:hypothetical protein